MDKIKYIRLELPDGSFSQDIPLSVDANYVEMGGSSLGEVLLSQSQQLSTTKSNIQGLKNADASLEATIDNNYEELSGAIESAVSGSPKGSYITTTALTAANPATGLYVIEEDGHVYSWIKDASEPIDLGIYRAEVDEKLIKEIDYYSKIYNAMPTIKGEGTDITLNDTVDSPLTLGFKASENAQDSTRGVQLFDKNNVNVLNASFSSDGKRITVSNNAKILYIACDPNTTYAVSKISSSRFRLLTTENVPTLNVQGIDYKENDAGTSLTITTSSNTNYLCVYYYLNGTDTLTEQEVLDNIQIEEGVTATDFEPYTGGIASPNPDYPQDIHVIKGDNEVKIHNVNLWDEEWEIGGINASTGQNGSNPNVIRSTNYIPVKPNTDYYFKNDTDAMWVFGYDENKNYIGYATGSTSSIRNVIRTTPVNCYYIKFQCRSEYGTTYNNDICINVSNANVNGTYTPHKEQNYSINLGVRNLFDKDNANTLNANFNTGGINTITSNATSKTIYIECKTNKTYTLQKSKGARFFVGYTETIPNIGVEIYGRSGFNNANTLTVTTNNNAKYLVAFVYNSSIDTSLTEQEILDSIQIEEGPIAHSYSPYGQEPIEMCNINNYADEIFKNVPECEYYDSLLEEGKWYKYSKIGKIVLDGSEDWKMQYAIGLFNLSITNLADIRGGFCNEYIYNSIQSGMADGLPNLNFALQHFTSTAFTLFIKNLSFDNLNDFILDLASKYNSDKPVTIYYPLATPTKTLLSDTLQTQLDNILYAMAYQDQTNISQINEDRSFIINAKAVMDLSSLAMRIAVLESEA